jgi:voltage-gated potassium channel
MRKRIYEIIEKSDGNDRLSSLYDYMIIVVIVVSLVPLAFKSDIRLFQVADRITVSIFIMDYFLRFITADFRSGEKSAKTFLRYPFSFMAIIDLISILPSLTVVNSGFKLLRILRMIRAMRVVRVFKVMRYSKSFAIIGSVLRASKNSLVAVCALASGYIVISALVIFNVEPNSFETFFDAIYWATVSLTTVGYGDIYPVSTIGRIVTMLSSIFGIAIVALPAGIITAGYMNEIEKVHAESIDEE